MACFSDINVSQGSVATYARCGGIFNIHLTANLPRNLSVKKFLNRSRTDRIMVMSLWPRFWPTLYMIGLIHKYCFTVIRHWRYRYRYVTAYSFTPPTIGVTSHRQPRQCREEQRHKTVKGAQSDPNYVYLD